MRFLKLEEYQSEINTCMRAIEFLTEEELEEKLEKGLDKEPVKKIYQSRMIVMQDDTDDILKKIAEIKKNAGEYSTKRNIWDDSEEDEIKDGPIVII